MNLSAQNQGTTKAGARERQKHPRALKRSNSEPVSTITSSLSFPLFTFRLPLAAPLSFRLLLSSRRLLARRAEIEINRDSNRHSFEPEPWSHRWPKLLREPSPHAKDQRVGSQRKNKQALGLQICWNLSPAFISVSPRFNFWHLECTSSRSWM